ncbi:tectonic-3-like isoform X5 [Paramisgurnus dabryanus]|uniref:tectonic-3-like isoform X5 n=1 Tax=Paramisgurnus dabryanus TaxID=90735 RepID=UPI0031F435BD
MVLGSTPMIPLQSTLLIQLKQQPVRSGLNQTHRFHLQRHSQTPHLLMALLIPLMSIQGLLQPLQVMPDLPYVLLCLKTIPFIHVPSILYTKPSTRHISVVRDRQWNLAAGALFQCFPKVFFCCSGCLCDVTPDFCDIGCCCDGIDCGLLNLSSVFNDCNQALGSGTCLESWMMFTANINPLLVTRSGDLFCVQKEEEMQSDVQTSPAVYQSIYLYPLLLREPAAFNIQKNNFYKVDDIILIYFNRTSIVSTLRQPSTGPASSACVNRNPARFLRSSSLSCSRTVTTQSCVEDNSLSARTYYTGFSLLRVPQAQVETRPELLIPISTVRDWPEPREQNGSCFNVVSKVEYGIEYTGKGEIVKITMNAELITANPNTQFLQTHTVTFQLATSTPSMTTPTPVSGTEGLKSGSPVIVWFGGKSQPLTVLRSSENGECLARPANRSPVFFKQNVMTGCTFRSSASDCGVLRAELMEVLSAAAVPELISMTTGDQAEKSKVILQDCSLPASELCETGCMLPISLSVQVLWAQRGLRALPQNHILGAKFVFSCDRLKCPLRSSIPVTAGVVFTETTVYPEAPRGEPKPEWKFPFAFFTGGAGEFDQE